MCVVARHWCYISFLFRCEHWSSSVAVRSETFRTVLFSCSYRTVCSKYDMHRPPMTNCVDMCISLSAISYIDTFVTIALSPYSFCEKCVLRSPHPVNYVNLERYNNCQIVLSRDFLFTSFTQRIHYVDIDLDFWKSSAKSRVHKPWKTKVAVN